MPVSITCVRMKGLVSPTCRIGACSDRTHLAFMSPEGHTTQGNARDSRTGRTHFILKIVHFVLKELLNVLRIEAALPAVLANKRLHAFEWLRRALRDSLATASDMAAARGLWTRRCLRKIER
jgi:hypothetical protein